MEPTSEQELKQLLEEGRITEEEYQELLEAIRKKEAAQKPIEASQKSNESKPRAAYGKAAIIFMIVGLLLLLAPILFNIISGAYSSTSVKKGFIAIGICPFLFLSLLCELLAFIFGIIGWRSASGKFAVIGVPCLGLLVILGLLPLYLFMTRVSLHVPAESEYLISHKAYPLDTIEGVLAEDDVNIDDTVFTQGSGSLRIVSDFPEKRTIRLFETGPMGIDECMLIYSAKLKSDLNSGKSYLEMWCDIPGKGEFFSRGLDQPVTGATNWTTEQTPFRLESGQMPANIKLNLVIEGLGTVWIDDIKLLSSPLN